ncbi:MAG: hypothetical protein KDC35_10945 [Acidobacteria bacterium]|nr:hypothetical protein [Acidobacteriota bacterium]
MASLRFGFISQADTSAFWDMVRREWTTFDGFLHLTPWTELLAAASPEEMSSSFSIEKAGTRPAFHTEPS